MALEVSMKIAYPLWTFTASFNTTWHFCSNNTNTKNNNNRKNNNNNYNNICFVFQNETPQGSIDKNARTIVKAIQQEGSSTKKKRQTANDKTSRLNQRRMTIMESVAAKQKKAEFTNLEKEFKKKFQSISESLKFVFFRNKPKKENADMFWKTNQKD